MQLHRELLRRCYSWILVQAYYQRNRRGQLNNDLAVPANFLAAYEKYVAQLVGFFIIEDRVGRTAEALSEVNNS